MLLNGKIGESAGNILSRRQKQDLMRRMAGQSAAKNVDLQTFEFLFDLRAEDQLLTPNSEDWQPVQTTTLHKRVAELTNDMMGDTTE